MTTKPAPTQPGDQSQRIEVSRRFAVEVARLSANTRCHNVIVMELAGLSPITDFFVIASGTSARQMRTVSDDIAEMAEKFGMKMYHCSGYEGESWIACDYVDVVVHLFTPDARLYYDLEGLWGDAKKIDWQP